MGTSASEVALLHGQLLHHFTDESESSLFLISAGYEGPTCVCEKPEGNQPLAPMINETCLDRKAVALAAA